MDINIHETRFIPDKPKVLPNEQIEIYIPTASYGKPGVASFDTRGFIVDALGNVKLRRNSLRNIETFTINPITGVVYIKYDDGTTSTTNVPVTTDALYSRNNLMSVINITPNSFVVDDNTGHWLAIFSKEVTGFNDADFITSIEYSGKENSKQGYYTVTDSVFKGDDGSVLLSVDNKEDVDNFYGRLLLLGGSIFTDNQVVSINYDERNRRFIIHKTDGTIEYLSAISESYLRDYVDQKMTSLYVAKGNINFADLPTVDDLASGNYMGFVYNVTDNFVADARFNVNDYGKSFSAGTNIVVIRTDEGNYEFDILGGLIDLSHLVNKQGDTMTGPLIFADESSTKQTSISNTSITSTNGSTIATLLPNKLRLRYVSSGLGVEINMNGFAIQKESTYITNVNWPINPGRLITIGDVATSDGVEGLVSVINSNGLTILDDSGHIALTEPTNAQINTQSNDRVALMPKNISNVVKIGLTNSKVTYSNTDKDKVCDVVGAVRINDTVNSLYGTYGTILPWSVEPTVDSIVRRANDGNIRTVTPKNGSDVTPKNYVDAVKSDTIDYVDTSVATLKKYSDNNAANKLTATVDERRVTLSLINKNNDELSVTHFDLPETGSGDVSSEQLEPIENALEQSKILTPLFVESAFDSRVTANGKNVLNASKAVLHKVVGNTVVVGKDENGLNGKMANVSFGGLKSTGKNLCKPFSKRIAVTSLTQFGDGDGYWFAANRDGGVHLIQPDRNLGSGNSYYIDGDTCAFQYKAVQRGIGFDVPCAVGKSYVLSFENLTPEYNTAIAVAFFNTNNEVLSSKVSNGTSVIATPPEGCKYILFIIAPTGNSVSTDTDFKTIKITNIQFEEGTQATEYEPYFEPSILDFPKTELPLSATIDFEQNKIVEEYQKLVLTGNETMQQYTGYQNEHGLGVKFSQAVPDVQNGSFEGYSTDDTLYRDGVVAYRTLFPYNGDLYWIGALQATGCTNVDEFKAYLANRVANGNPVTILYKLVTPKETEIEKGNEYTVWSGGTETVLENDGASSGVLPTLTQSYTVVNEIGSGGGSSGGSSSGGITQSEVQAIAEQKANVALASAKTYADGKATDALNTAKSYTDEKVGNIETALTAILGV